MIGSIGALGVREYDTGSLSMEGGEILALALTLWLRLPVTMTMAPMHLLTLTQGLPKEKR